MDPVTIIVTALAAGAVDAFKPAAEEAVQDAYHALKNALADKFGRDSDIVEAAGDVEKRPGSKARQAVLQEELTAVEDQLDDTPQLAQALLQAIEASGSTTYTATESGGGSIAQGEGNVVAGRGGVAVGGNVQGGIQMGDTISGDYIGGDKVLGDKIGKQIGTKIEGDSYNIGNISDSSGVAIGRQSNAEVSITQQSQSRRGANFDAMFAGLKRIAYEQDPQQIDKVEALQEQVALGAGADDDQVASLIHEIVKEVPDTKRAIKKLFKHPDVSLAAGPATQFALKIME